MLNKNHQSFWWDQYSLGNHCTEQKPMVLYEFWKIWVRHHFVYFFGLRVGNYGFILWHWGCEVNLMAVKTQELIELHYSWINYEIESTKFKESIENILPRIINKFLWLLLYYPVFTELQVLTITTSAAKQDLIRHPPNICFGLLTNTKYETSWNKLGLRCAKLRLTQPACYWVDL